MGVRYSPSHSAAGSGSRCTILRKPISRRATRISSGWHLDLSDAAAQAWLRRRPWPPDVVEMVAAPIQRGRLFIAPDRAYGHLRDFRDEPDAVTLQAGSL